MTRDVEQQLPVPRTADDLPTLFDVCLWVDGEECIATIEAAPHVPSVGDLIEPRVGPAHGWRLYRVTEVRWGLYASRHTRVDVEVESV